MTKIESTKPEGYYTIGEVSKICNVSKKTLRFYDKIGLISPDSISEETGYRYYKEETLLFVPVIKYFKQMGFRLEEMKEFLNAETYDVHLEGFRDKIDDLKRQQEEIYVASQSVSDWYNLILEAKSVLENKAVGVSVKYVEIINAPYIDFQFHNNYMESIINIDWTNHLEETGQAITGAVHIIYENMREKLEGKPTKAKIFQRGTREIANEKRISVGGEMMLAAYHLGSHDDIGKTYDKIFTWARMNGYDVGDMSIERYVSDYWTLKRTDSYVTEVLVEIKK